MLQLRWNPFEHQSTYDFDDYKSQPFILDGLETPKVLKNKLIWNVTSNQRVLIKIISTKGAGKSTLSFYLQDSLEQLKNSNLLIFYTSKIGLEYYNLLGSFLHEFNIDTNGFKNNEEAIKHFLEDKKIYLFIDFQDILVSSYFKILANTLEKIGNLSKNISIILTMNKVHAVKMEAYSYVLGKYTSFELPGFSLGNTNSLIKERLKTARKDNYEGDELYPFQKLTELIFNHSGGIPRNILSACDLLLSNFEDGEIDLDLASLLLKGEFAKKVIYDMTLEGYEREYLMQLYDVVRNDFNGEISKEKDLTDYMEKNKGWSNKTTSKRLRKLFGFGLLNINKGEDLWSNVIRII